MHDYNVKLSQNVLRRWLTRWRQLVFRVIGFLHRVSVPTTQSPTTTHRKGVLRIGGSNWSRCEIQFRISAAASKEDLSIHKNSKHPFQRARSGQTALITYFLFALQTRCNSPNSLGESRGVSRILGQFYMLLNH